MSTSAALRAVRKFRLHELNGLKSHNKRFGYLPLKPDADPEAIHLRNPFLPLLNDNTGRWAPPKYSLRRQAELVKSAKAANLLHLLPPGPKVHSSEIQKAELQAAPQIKESSAPPMEEPWLLKIAWVGNAKEKDVKGADLGTRLYAAKKRMFKGHKWERVKRKRFSYKKILLRDMDARIQRYKAVRSTFHSSDARTDFASSTTSTDAQTLCLFLVPKRRNFRSSLYLPLHNTSLEPLRVLPSHCHLGDALSASKRTSCIDRIQRYKDSDR